MKKNTLKKLLLTFLCVITLQTYAQELFDGGLFRLVTLLASPNYHPTRTSTFHGSFVAAEYIDGSSTIKMRLVDEINPSQLFRFVPVPGKTFNFAGVERQVYNIICNATNEVIFRESTDSNNSPARKRSVSYPADEVLRGDGHYSTPYFVVSPYNDGLIPSHRIVSVSLQPSATYDRRFLQPNLDYSNLHVAGPDAPVRLDIDKWSMQEIEILNTDGFDTSSIFITNPVNNKLIINGLTSRVQEISVFSLLGKRISQQVVNGKSQININMANQYSGVYIIKITGDYGSFSKKVVKK